MCAGCNCRVYSPDKGRRQPKHEMILITSNDEARTSESVLCQRRVPRRPVSAAATSFSCAMTISLRVAE